MVRDGFNTGQTTQRHCKCYEILLPCEKGICSQNGYNVTTSKKNRKSSEKTETMMKLFLKLFYSIINTVVIGDIITFTHSIIHISEPFTLQFEMDKEIDCTVFEIRCWQLYRLTTISKGYPTVQRSFFTSFCYFLAPVGPLHLFPPLATHIGGSDA